MAGKTIEILNTDAEGRLILIDAITYGKQLGINRIVDAATLTGAISIALGAVNVGAFSNDDTWQTKLLDAAKAAGEKMWPMPMDEEYKDLLKCAFADMPNIGSRGAGSITAALFLKEWVEDTPWVHLDIAGTAWIDDGKAWLSKGPTGVSMRTFVELAKRLA
jgi:leucyl aminopeptidase